jgi:transposase
MWYAGIDWANDHHDTVVIDEAGNQVASLRVSHSKAGLGQLTTFLQHITGAEAKEQLACIIETSHGLLVAALLEAGFPVYPVNSQVVDRRRKPAGAKTDAIDAYLLAKTGRSEFHDLHRLHPDGPIVQELKLLTRDQDQLIQQQTRLTNKLIACLKAYYPAALQFFTSLHQHSALVFLQTYSTPQAAQVASVAQMAAVLKAAHHTNPTKVAQHIWQVLQEPQLTADAITTRTQARLVQALVSQLIPLIEQIASYDKEIATLFFTHEDLETFSQLPGAGKRLAPRLLAEWGDDRTRYRTASAVQALAGTAPVPFESGKYAKVHKRYACVKPFRNALHQFAWESVRLEPWAKAYYQRKRQAGKSHSMAVRALANIWVRIIFALWSKHERYEPATFLAAQQAHRPLAA